MDIVLVSQDVIPAIAGISFLFIEKAVRFQLSLE